MTALTWLLVAAALALAPLGEPVTARVQELSGRGRLAALRTHSGPGRARRSAPLDIPAGVAGAAAGVVVGAATSLAAGPVLGTAFAIVVACAVHVSGTALRRRAADRRNARLGAAVALLAAELDAGSTPGAALRGAAELDASHGEAFRTAAAAADAGSDLALTGDSELIRLGLAWSIASLTGAPLADVLSRLSADLAALTDRRRAVAVALAGPRSSAAMLALLPLLGVGLGLAMGARPLEFLFGDRLGQVVCLTGVVLDVLGVLWTRRLAAAAERS